MAKKTNIHLSTIPVLYTFFSFCHSRLFLYSTVYSIIYRIIHRPWEIFGPSLPTHKNASHDEYRVSVRCFFKILKHLFGKKYSKFTNFLSELEKLLFSNLELDSIESQMLNLEFSAFFAPIDDTTLDYKKKFIKILKLGEIFSEKIKVQNFQIQELWAHNLLVYLVLQSWVVYFKTLSSFYCPNPVFLTKIKTVNEIGINNEFLSIIFIMLFWN